MPFPQTIVPPLNNESATGAASEAQAGGNQTAIDEALKQIGVNREDGAGGQSLSGRPLLWIYIIGALALVVTGRLLDQGLIPPGAGDALFLQRLSLAGFLIFAILATRELLTAHWIPRVSDAPSRYNLNRIIGLFAALAIFMVVISVLFVNWTAALVSLGALSVLFGLALQTSLGNLFAWFYILIRKPYQVGDRIRINDATGDVIDVGYLDTTLWEFGGQYLSSDHPSGRIIKFPNSLVLNQAVYNYSWPLFPYIWNEVRVYVAYGSDMEFIATTMTQAATEEIGDTMKRHVDQYRSLLARTPVDEIQVNEKPVVLFRTNENTWIEAIVRYLVEPKQAGPIKTRILRKCLHRLNQSPDKALFPKGDSR